MKTVQGTAEKPVCKITGTDGNIFALLGRITSTLKKAGQASKVEEVTQKVFACNSYEQALGVFEDYVEVH